METRSRQDKYKHILYVEKGAKMVKIEKRTYKKILKKLLADYPILQAKVGKRGYGFKHVERTLKEYNAYVNRKTESEPAY